MKEVLYVMPFADGFLAHCINDTGVKQQIAIYEARGAIVKPVDNNPGYYLFIGIQREPNIFEKNPLLFLVEGESHSQEELFKKVLEDGTRMKATTVYADQSKDKRQIQGFYRDLWRYFTDNRTSMRLKGAPSVKDYAYGDSLIKDWNLKKALTRSSFVTPTAMDRVIFDEMNKESDITSNQFYPFHALRYLLAGLVKNPVRIQAVTGFAGDEVIIKSSENKLTNAEGWT